MKKLLYLGAMLLVFAGCSVENTEDAILDTYDVNGKSSVSNMNVIYPEGEFCVGEEVSFTFNVPDGTNNIKVQEEISPGEWETVFQVAANTNAPAPYVYTTSWDSPGTHTFRYFAGPGGHTEISPITISNCSNCTNELNVEYSCNEPGNLNISFYAEEAGPIVIQGGLTNGTTIESMDSNILTFNQNHPSVGNSNANVTRWEGEIESCEEVTINIQFDGGNGIGDWSAKRGETVLGSSEEIECDN